MSPRSGGNAPGSCGDYGLSATTGTGLVPVAEPMHAGGVFARENQEEDKLILQYSDRADRLSSYRERRNRAATTDPATPERIDERTR
ncbi:hypothetical protein [Saccharopolyspora erythraea]|uniref:Uncharacterized protein n=1 Tax=Saccharopolyspora erythraea TaxID=1836 RepID=A0ABP3M8W9_SACER|nr:hypothetical protein [Saccharopolyspora erythraea]QRK92718.1 hypothetical protein JQX30_16330 [Saccharopolyspora erythraea]